MGGEVGRIWEERKDWKLETVIEIYCMKNMFSMKNC